MVYDTPVRLRVIVWPTMLAVQYCCDVMPLLPTTVTTRMVPG